MRTSELGVGWGTESGAPEAEVNPRGLFSLRRKLLPWPLPPVSSFLSSTGENEASQVAPPLPPHPRGGDPSCACPTWVHITLAGIRLGLGASFPVSIGSTPMKCSISVHLLPVPPLWLWAPVESPEGPVRKDLTLLHLGRPCRLGSSLLPPSCSVPQGNSGTSPSWGPRVSLASGGRRAGEQWWPTCLGSGKPGLQSRVPAGLVAAWLSPSS